MMLLTRLRLMWIAQMDVEFILKLAGVPGRVWRKWKLWRLVSNTRNLVPQILSHITVPMGTPPPSDWMIQRAVYSHSKGGVIILGPRAHGPAAVLKLHQGNATPEDRKEREILATLRADPRLDDFLSLVPKSLSEGEIGGYSYSVETAMPGDSALTRLSNPDSLTRMLEAAASSIGEFHHRTAKSAVVKCEMLERWIERPLLNIRGLESTLPRFARHNAALDRVALELREALANRTLPVGWIHGDFAPGNILVDPEGSSVTGIVDWDQAAPNELPQIDLLHLLLSTRTLVQRRQLGEVVTDVIEGDRWTPHEHRLIDQAQSALPGEVVGIRPIVLLSWLHHVSATLTKSNHYSGHSLWIAKNVEGVLIYV